MVSIFCYKQIANEAILNYYDTLTFLSINGIANWSFRIRLAFDRASQGGRKEERRSKGWRGRTRWRTRSGHSVPCRYSSRAARDTKHWPQAKTNYNGLHSPRNAFLSWPQPFGVTGDGIAHEPAIDDVDVVHAPFSRRCESIPVLSPSLCLAKFPPPCSGNSVSEQPHQGDSGWPYGPRGGTRGRTRGRPRRGNEEQESVRFEREELAF